MKIYHINLARGFSGGEQQTLALINQHQKEQRSFAVVALKNSPFYDAVTKLGYEVISVSHYMLGHTVKLEKNAILHVHEGHAIYWAAIQNLIKKIPYIITRRLDNPIKSKWLTTFAYSHSAVIVGISQCVSKVIKQRFPTKNIVTIPDSPVIYPVDELAVSKIKQQFQGRFLVIQAGNMIPHKGHDVTLKAAKQLLKNIPNVHIALLGDGEQRETLEAYAKKHQLSNLSFMGKQNHMGDWFAAADLLIHPSYTEGLGSVILEAIQGGLPVIGTNAGGIPDIIEDKKSGLLIPVGDAEELAKAIELIAIDKPLRNQLQQGGKEKLSLFDIQYTASLYFKTYQSLPLSEKK